MRERSDLFTGLVIGGLLGVILGLLWAPAPGEETRRTLAERAGGAREVVGGHAARLGAQLRENAGTVGDRAAQSAQVLAERVRGQVSGLADRVGQGISDVVTGLQPTTEATEVLSEAAATTGGDG